jgi:hypothetical protein
MSPTFNKEQTVAVLGQETARQAIKNEQPQSPQTDTPTKIVDKPSQVNLHLTCPHCNKTIKLSIEH